MATNGSGAISNRELISPVKNTFFERNGFAVIFKELSILFKMCHVAWKLICTLVQNRHNKNTISHPENELLTIFRVQFLRNTCTINAKSIRLVKFLVLLLNCRLHFEKHRNFNSYCS